MFSFRVFCTIFFVLFLITKISEAQKKQLSYEQVFLNEGEKIIGSTPSLLGWFDAGNYLERNNEDSVNQILKVNAVNGESTVLVDFDKISEILPEDIKFSRDYKFTDDYSSMIFVYQNDLHYINFEAADHKQLTNDVEEEVNPRFSPDNNLIAYTKNRDLFYYDIFADKEYRLTNDASEVIYNGFASWVYYEEILGRGSRYAAFWWSPNSELIAFLRFDDSPVPKFPIYRSAGKHGELEWEYYPKAGDSLPNVKLGIASTEISEITWIDIDNNEEHMVAWPFWSADSKQLLFQWLNRDQNNLRIYSANPHYGDIKEIYNEKQKSWIEFFEDIYCLKNGNGFILRSDKSGWSHFYHYDYSGKLINRITGGSWAVTGISYVDETNKEIYFTGSKNKSTESHLYKSKLDGSGLKQITNEAGTHSLKVSPDGLYYYDRFSSITTPSVVNLYNGNGEKIRELGNSKLPVYDEYEIGKVELFTIPSGDGFELPARWILPADFERSKKYPVLFKVYGGPGRNSVTNSFQRLSDFYYAQEGIIVISVDHRGSGHFGKEGISLMHRNLGKWEMHDYIAAVKWLKEKSFIDTSKIGITGGSYGGYVTSLALTQGSDYFTHGIAHFSVTDWLLYDNVYTERYMDKPEDNTEGYKAGSVFTYVDKYKGLLRLTHGAMDDNVHMQNTIQLIDKLIDANKEFELIIYPGQRHGIRGVKKKHATRETNNFWFKHLLNEEID